MLIQRPKNWIVKPPVGSQINWGHPLAQGLAGCWLFNEQGGAVVRNLAAGDTSAAFTSPAWRVSPSGYAGDFNGTSGFITVAAHPKIDNLGPLTLVFRAVYSGTLGRYLLDKSDGNVVNGDWWVEITTGNEMAFVKELGTTNISRVTSSSGLAGGVWFTGAITWNGVVGAADSVRLYINGREASYGVTQTGAGARADLSLDLHIARRKSNSTFLASGLDYLYLFNRALPPNEIAALFVTPYAPIQPPRRFQVFIPPTANVSLTADVGAFTLAGQTAGLLRALQLGAEAGSFSLSGQDAELRFGRQLSAEVGGYLLSGHDAAFAYHRNLAASAGAFALAGQAATFSYIRRLSAETGSFALAGQEANLSITPAPPTVSSISLNPASPSGTVSGASDITLS